MREATNKEVTDAALDDLAGQASHGTYPDPSIDYTRGRDTVEQHFHFHFCNPADHKMLSLIVNKLDRILERENIIMGELDTLTAQVAENTDAEASAIQLLTNLHDMLVKAGTDPAKLNALKEQLASSKAALAAAIVANTPAE